MLSRARFHARQVAYDLTSGLFFRPALIILGLSAVAVAITVTIGSQRGIAWLFPGEPSAAQVVLGTIASSMMTVVSVVYSILLVALSLASMQFSTRILRRFVSDKTSQVTLGLFVGTFVYCLLLLRVVHGGEDPVVPALGVGLAILLAVVSMGQLVYFIHHIVRFIQANHLVDGIASEAEEVIDAVFPERAAAERGLPAGWEALPRWEVPARASGYVQLVDVEELASVARAAGGVVAVRVGVGHFATEGIPCATLHAPKEPPPDVREVIADSFDIGPVRTMQDDAEWGIRQIVDIALKAISPAVNDPSTAATCIDHLGRLLVRAARRTEPVGVAGVGPDGIGRVVSEPSSLASLIDLGFTQIRQYGRADMAVTLRLLRVLEHVANSTRSQEALARVGVHAKLVLLAATAHFPEEDRAEMHARSAAIETALAG
jgi:uncharacterized membrane protein